MGEEKKRQEKFSLGQRRVFRRACEKPSQVDSVFVSPRLRQGVAIGSRPAPRARTNLVDLKGFEPPTPWLQTRCSPN